MPLLDEQGARIGSVHVARDITERDCAQEALRQSEEKFRGIFENTLVGIFQSTPEGRYITVNPACARMFGYSSPEDMIRSVTDISMQVYWDPVERQKCVATLESSGKLERFEVKCRRKDGSPMWTVINSRNEQEHSAVAGNRDQDARRVQSGRLPPCGTLRSDHAVHARPEPRFPQRPQGWRCGL
jgi:PAS domain S-box-containing protein